VNDRGGYLFFRQLPGINGFAGNNNPIFGQIIQFGLPRAGRPATANQKTCSKRSKGSVCRKVITGLKRAFNIPDDL
jgi:hypothetical protein